MCSLEWLGCPIDPVTLILEALATGAAGATTTAVNDAYAGLKALLRRRFRSEPEPGQLRELLAGVDDPELVRSASDVLRAADPAGYAAGKYQVTVTGSRGVVIGDHNEVTQHFD